LAVVKAAREPRSRQLSHPDQETRHEKQGRNTYQRRAPQERALLIAHAS